MKELFIKYLKRECSEEEIEQIVSYFRNSTDFSDVPAIDAIYELLEDEYPEMEETSATRIFDAILETADKKSKKTNKKRNRYWKYAAAAILISVSASTYLLRNTIFNNPVKNAIPVIVNNQIKPGTDKAILTLADGSQVALEKGTDYKTKNVTSNGEEIIYETNKANKTAIVYNTLTIPRGGQFVINLADGTKIWLNSESQLKFPVAFVDGESRKVELVYGEAYFDVSHSTEHKGSNFKVYNKNQEIEVLGTEFNVSAYKDESHIYTTLVKGKVSVNTITSNKILAPNQQSDLDISSKNIEISTIDVNNEIAWINGEFRLQHKTLKEIMKTLSRWYDMDVVFADKKLENQRFVGIVRKKQNIEDILNSIKNFNLIKNYEIKDKQVTIK